MTHAPLRCAPEPQVVKERSSGGIWAEEGFSVASVSPSSSSSETDKYKEEAAEAKRKLQVNGSSRTAGRGGAGRHAKSLGR